MGQMFTQIFFRQQGETQNNQSSDQLLIKNKINEIVLNISKQTVNTKEATPLYEIFNELDKLLQYLDNFKLLITDSQAMVFYQKYRSFIKQSQNKTLTLSKASMNPTPEKMEEIKKDILEMMEKIKTLHNQATVSTQKHILWMDSNEINNSFELEKIQKDYKDKANVKYYTDNSKFREDVMKLKDFPLVIILSAAAAGSNIQHGDGDHFKFLKEKKSILRLMGVVIYCGQVGYDNLKGLLKDESYLLQSITIDYDQMMDAIKYLFFPIDFKRVISLNQLDSFLSKPAKDTMQQWSQKDWSSRSLVDLHPNKVNYQEIFKKGKDLIVSEKIKMSLDLIQKMENIPNEIEKLFQSTNLTNEELSKQLIRLYSSEDVPVYKVLNSTLNIINEELINIMQPFIDLFLIALYYYDDLSDTKIKQPISNSDPIVYDFYKGTTIPKNQFDNEDSIKVNNFITLPGFSSFSDDLEIACSFISLNTGFEVSFPVIFHYKYKTANKYFNNRPKFIEKVSDYKEKEYLVYPFTLFRITEIIPPTDQKEYYEIVLTVN